MDIIVYMQSGIRYEMESVLCIQHLSKSDLINIYKKNESPFVFPFVFKKDDIVSIKIKGGFYEHKEG